MPAGDVALVAAADVICEAATPFAQLFFEWTTIMQPFNLRSRPLYRVASSAAML